VDTEGRYDKTWGNGGGNRGGNRNQHR
jgi:hypothetical protein